jgi:hypothetical protein
MRWHAVAAVVIVVLASGCGGHRDRLRLSVTPTSALADVPLTVRVTGLRASGRVTISVLGSSHLDKPWRTVLTARADASGLVELRRAYLVARLRPVQKPSADDYLPWAQDLTIVASTASGTAKPARSGSFSLRPSRSPPSGRAASASTATGSRLEAHSGTPRFCCSVARGVVCRTS